VLHHKENLAENKLLLLYALYKIRQPMTLDQLTMMCADLDLMYYFDMRQHLLEMGEDKLIRIDHHDKLDFHVILPDGLEMVNLFKKRLSPALREKMDQYLIERRQDFSRQTEILAFYSEDSPMEFPVSLKIRENNMELFSMQLSAPSSAMAARLCRLFRREGDQIYADLVRRLTEHPTKEED
jgi:hypothetical protein